MKKNYKFKMFKVSLMPQIAFLTLLFSSIGLHAQKNPIDFESTGNGATWTWTVFENSSNPAVEIITNPDQSGINTSSKVMKFTALQAGQPWAGCESMHGSADLDTFSWNSNNRIIKIMVWKPVISDVGIKFATGSGWAETEVKVANTKINEWEELTFDFTGKINPPSGNGVLGQIIIFPDFNTSGRSADNICYVDNITFNAGTASEPTTAAPTPTQPSADVISMFSNAYTNISVNTWRTDWSSATLSDVQIAGNDTKKYSSLDFVGIETVGANVIDISNMLYFHLDLWTPNITTFRVKIVDFGADGNFGGGDDREHEVSLIPSQNGWNSLDIPLSDFTGLTTKGHIAQIIFSCAPAGQGTLYLDNVYFHKTPLIDPNTPQVAASTPTFPSANVISLFSNAYTNKTVNTWRTDWSAATLQDVQIEGNDTKKYSSLDFVGIETVGANVIDATNMTHFYFNAWTPNLTSFKVKLVDFGADGAFAGGDDKEHELTLTAPTLSSWNTYDLLLSSFTGLTTKAHIAQLILVGTPTGAGTVFVDNVLFRKEEVSSVSNATLNTINVYPNPATEQVTLSSTNTIASVELFNSLGQKVLNLNSDSNTVTIDIANLNKGIYTIKTNTDNGQSVSKLIVE
jgi:hypothetical protein